MLESLMAPNVWEREVTLKSDRPGRDKLGLANFLLFNSRNCFIAAAFVLLGCQHSSDVGEAHLAYPTTERGSESDSYHGIKVEDPYQWLEEMNSKKTLDWTHKQDSVARNFVEGLPGYEQIRNRVAELSGHGKVGDYVERGDFYFYIESVPKQPQAVLIAERVETGKRKILVDPNLLSDDGAVAIVDYSPSPSGKLLTYALVNGPSRYYDWRTINVATGEEYSETVSAALLVTGSSAFRNSWTKDEAGYFYKRFSQIDRESPSTTPAGLGLYFHRLGELQVEDVLVFERPDNDNIRFDGVVSDDGTYLVIREYNGLPDGDAIFYKELNDANAQFKPLIKGEYASFNFLGNQDSHFWFMTNHSAVNRRIIEVDIQNSSSSRWKELVPEANDALDQAFVFGDRFLLSYLHDAVSFVRIHETNGHFVREVPLPVGLVWNMFMRYWSGFTGGRHEQFAFIRNLGINSAGSIYSLDMNSGDLTMQKRSKTKFRIEDYVTEQVFFNSADGTRIPMFLTHKSGIELDGQHPTLLWAYGAYGFTAQPFFNAKYAAFLEMDGILAMPNIRGGGAYGLDWYESGSRAQKTNTIDDICAASEWLIQNGYTSATKLTLEGNSAGATVVGGALMKRPDLFGAVIMEVPITDMLRAIKFKGGDGWVSTFGTPEIEEEFHALRSYSPYHTVNPEACYPPVFIAAGDKDVTAVPMHAYKLTAALQFAQESCQDASPIILRVDWGTDHGQNKPETNRQAEYVAELTFLHYALKLDIYR